MPLTICRFFMPLCQKSCPIEGSGDNCWAKLDNFSTNMRVMVDILFEEPKDTLYLISLIEQDY